MYECVCVAIVVVVIYISGGKMTPTLRTPLPATDLNLGSHIFTPEANLTPNTPTLHLPTTDQKRMNLFFKDAERNQSLSFKNMTLNSYKFN